MPEGSGGAEGRPGQSLTDEFEPGFGSALASIGLTISDGRLRFDRAPTAHRAWTWRKGSGAVGVSALYRRDYSRDRPVNGASDRGAFDDFYCVLVLCLRAVAAIDLDQRAISLKGHSLRSLMQTKQETWRTTKQTVKAR
jgi:hypothetical protein